MSLQVDNSNHHHHSKTPSPQNNQPQNNQPHILSNGNSITSMTTVYKASSSNLPSQSNSIVPSMNNSRSNSLANSRSGSRASSRANSSYQLSTASASNRSSSIVFNTLFNVDKNFNVDMYIGRSDVTLVQQDNRKKYSILPFSCIKKCAITKVNQLLVIEERVPGGDDTIRHRYQTEHAKEIAMTFSKIFTRLSKQK